MSKKVGELTLYLLHTQVTHPSTFELLTTSPSTAQRQFRVS